MESRTKKVSFNDKLSIATERVRSIIEERIPPIMFVQCKLCYFDMDSRFLRTIIIEKLGYVDVCNDCVVHVHDNCKLQDCTKCYNEEFYGWTIHDQGLMPQTYTPCNFWLQEHYKRLKMFCDNYQQQLDKTYAALYYMDATITTYLCLRKMNLFPKDIVCMLARYVYDSYTK